MKRILMVIVFVFMYSGVATAAPFVACDPDTSGAVVDSQVSVDGVIYETDICTYFVDGNGDAILMDWEAAVPPIPPGMHTIRAQFIDANGIAWGWSDPLVAPSLGTPGIVRLKAAVTP